MIGNLLSYIKRLFGISIMLSSCPIMPLPVRSSVVRASTNPTIAARPFNCSENDVKPWGIDLFSSTMPMRRFERRDVATAILRDDGVKDDAAMGDTVGRAIVGATETKAIVNEVDAVGRGSEDCFTMILLISRG